MPTLQLNESINFEKELIYVAIPKTGSTALRNQISPGGPYFVGNSHLNICQIRDLIYFYLLSSMLGKNRNFPSQGVPSDSQIRKSARDLFAGCFKFSVVRNPWARVCSLYFRREGITLADQIGFDEFCERHVYASDTCIHPTLHRNQRDWLVGEDGTLLVDFVCKIEKLSENLTRIAELSGGRLHLSNQVANKNQRSTPYQEMYNDHTRALIARRFEEDIDAFGYTFDS